MYRLVLPAAGAAILGTAEILRELTRFKVKRYVVKVPQMKKAKENIKIVFLSDLHAKVYGKDNEKLLDAIKKEEPDLILSGGDMLVRSREETAGLAAHFMEQLTGIGRVCCANGNHEQLMKEAPGEYKGRYEAYKKRLERAGIRILENTSLNMDIKGFAVTVTGLEVPSGCYGHMKELPLSVKEIRSRIGRPDEGRYQILLAHNPVYMEQYKDWGADLTLSGHLHGGIVRIPGIGGIITPQMKFFPRYSGDIYREAGHCGIVSRGLGTHTVNIRLFNMAEVVTVTLAKP